MFRADYSIIDDRGYNLVCLNGNPLIWEEMAFTDDIVTERLQIHPLNDEEFSALMNGPEQLEQKLGISVSGERPDSGFLMMLDWTALQMVVHRGEFPWRTIWHIRLRQENRTVGYLCFQGEPDETNGVEFGYFCVLSEYWGKGMMTEAVDSMTGWALAQENVQYVMAEVEEWNIPAQRVFEKNDFLCYNSTEDSKFYCKRLPALD